MNIPQSLRDQLGSRPGRFCRCYRPKASTGARWSGIRRGPLSTHRCQSAGSRFRSSAKSNTAKPTKHFRLAISHGVSCKALHKALRRAGGAHMAGGARGRRGDAVGRPGHGDWGRWARREDSGGPGGCRGGRRLGLWLALSCRCAATCRHPAGHSRHGMKTISIARRGYRVIRYDCHMLTPF